MKKMFAAVALLLGTLTLSPASHAADPAIRIGFQPGTAPRFFVARDQRMFEKAGLAAAYSKFISGPTMLAALQGEDIDVAFMTTAPAIFGLSQGIDIRVFFIESDAAQTQALISTKDAAIKALADSFDYGTAILKEQTDQTMLQTVNAPFIGPSTRARAFTFLIGHTWDIYGQLAVYLRLNGHVPPASQRP